MFKLIEWGKCVRWRLHAGGSSPRDTGSADNNNAEGRVLQAVLLTLKSTKEVLEAMEAMAAMAVFAALS